MKQLFIMLAVAVLLTACNTSAPTTNAATAANTASKTVPQAKYFDHGTTNQSDTAGLKIVHTAKFNITDDSYKYLRQDNYYVDQFSCVVNGYSYYRLTNIHPNAVITGCVTKSWTYEHQTVSENVSFSLKPGEWKTFGCFYVTPSQPIAFKICSNFGTQQSCACN